MRAFGWELPFKERYLDILDASQRPYYLLFSIQRWLALVLDLMTAVIVTILTILIVKLRSQFQPEFVALALLNIMTFSQSLTYAIQEWTQLETSFGAVARVKTFCETLEAEDTNITTEAPPSNWPSKGHVTVENLMASYSVGGEPVLKGVSLDISPGSKIGICGRSGSGKSSLVSSFLRLLEISAESQVKFDGVDITTLPSQTIRNAVAVVPQNLFFLKNWSVRENLVPRGEHSDERIISVLRRLKVDNVVERIGGLDSPLDAERLSQGQCQLLCLARAALANKKIVLLDEVSSNVDERSEKLIREVIRDQFTGCTVIAIVHRLGAIADFDRVAVMSNGKLLEWDDPKVLLSRDSEFKRLWELGSN